MTSAWTFLLSQGTPLGRINETDLQALVSAASPESGRLEYTTQGIEKCQP